MTLELRESRESDNRRFVKMRTEAKKFDGSMGQASSQIAKSYFDQLDRSRRLFPNVDVAPRSSDRSRFYFSVFFFQNKCKRTHALEQKFDFVSLNYLVFRAEKLRPAISGHEWLGKKLSPIDRSFSKNLYRKSTDAEILPFVLLNRAKALLSDQNIHEAKRILRQGISRFPDDTRIANLMHAISPTGKAKLVKASGKRRENELSWIKDNFNEFRGKWVAVDEQGLVASADKLKDLLRKVQESASGNETPLMQYISSEQE